MCWRHLDHLLPLPALVADVKPGPAAALVVADPFGHLSGLHLLEVIALGAEPLINLLWAEESGSPRESVSRGGNDLISRFIIIPLCALLPPPAPRAHIPQVQDEAVSLVEAVPADRHLCRPHCAATLDLEKPLDDHFIGDDVLEPGGHAPFLRDKSKILKC